MQTMIRRNPGPEPITMVPAAPARSARMILFEGLAVALVTALLVIVPTPVEPAVLPAIAALAEAEVERERNRP
jgi:hypothetical protein